MKKIFIVCLLFMSCQPYELIVEDEIVKPSENTDGLVAYIYDGNIYTVNDVGNETFLVPNTAGATQTISLNYDKTKIAFRTSGGNVAIINIDGTGKEVLNQFSLKHFEWSKTDDLLYILENYADSLVTYGSGTPSVKFPKFLSNNAISFTLSNQNDIAYWYFTPTWYYPKLVINKPNGDSYDFEYYIVDYNYTSLNFSDDGNIITGFVFNIGVINEFSFNYTTSTVNSSAQDVFSNYIDKKIYKSDSESMQIASIDESGYPEGLNLYRFGNGGKTYALTNYDSPFIHFDWKR